MRKVNKYQHGIFRKEVGLSPPTSRGDCSTTTVSLIHDVKGWHEPKHRVTQSYLTNYLKVWVKS